MTESRKLNQAFEDSFQRIFEALKKSTKLQDTEERFN